MTKQEPIQGGPSRPPWIAFSIVAAVAIAIGIAFFVAQRKDIQEREERKARRQSRILSVETGTACGALKQAHNALDLEENGQLTSAIQEAHREALHALDTSGVVFGKPERLALFLFEDLKEAQRNQGTQSDALKRRMADRLQTAVKSCKETAES